MTEAKRIPLIDLSPFLNSTPSECINKEEIQHLVGEVHESCKNGGIFQVINHGVPLLSREKILSASKRFFDQPMEEKKKVSRDEAKNPVGYHDAEHTRDAKDSKEVYEFMVEIPTLMFASPEADDDRIIEYINQWPHHPPELREACEQYGKDVQQLSYKLLELISLSLNLPAKRLEPFFSKDQTSFIKLSYYPSCPSPDLALGVGPHKDSYALTILVQDDVGGLQVKRKTDGEWIFVNYIPNAFIVSVGDILQVWSNDMYESTEHRVILNSVKERFSIGLFLSPPYYTVVEPTVELIHEQNPAKYKGYNWGKYFATKRRSNFKKLDVENMQINRFKIDNKDTYDDVVSHVKNLVI